MLTFNFNVVWIFGLPSAGKSTLAKGLQQRFIQAEQACLRLDGDELREGLCRGLGFSPAGREENIRRAAEVAALSAKSGIYTVTALITPTDSYRKVARIILKDAPALWVWAKCSYDACQSRDVKGLYRKQREGHLVNLTGADGYFEEPSADEALHIDTENNDVSTSIDLIWAQLTKKHP
ncbi:adenylyl-sulfate kinase [Prosthecobacter dejongeii]|uniref:Adenylyl-sulfate kinase n=1 Tax=Prosthecobacter dejongeii TaxID=48465 RepID=A0A7W7YIH0_9BACT|nr:adenylyl-sulfate kinase [Prosthecobacter dejongeii]MBB5036793.1 adenylyl-sulfate kinase [Prosthecobacter dejongeii]